MKAHAKHPALSVALSRSNLSILRRDTTPPLGVRAGFDERCTCNGAGADGLPDMGRGDGKWAGWTMMLLAGNQRACLSSE